MRPRLYIALTLLLVLFACSDKKPTTPIKHHDQTPPAKITSLWICVENPTWADLCWYAPGDDSLSGKATAYDIRFSRSPITDSTWDSCTIAAQSLIPRDPTTGERFRLNGLDSGATYFAALKAVDDIGNWSALSNVVAINVHDTLPPMTITDLSGYLLTDSTYLLQWTAPRDSESIAPVRNYDIRYAAVPIDTSNWSSASIAGLFPSPMMPGLEQTAEMYWPSDDTIIFVGIRSYDRAGNFSLVSNNLRLDNPNDSIIYPPDTTVGMETIWGIECGERLGQTPVDMIATADGGMIIVSNWTDVFDQDIVIVKLDSLGNQQWETEVGGADRDRAAAVLVHPSGDYIVTGWSESFTDTSGDIYIARLSPSGSLIEDRSFGLTGTERINGATMLADGSLVMVGSAGTYLPTSVALVVKTDPQFNEVWRDHIVSYNSCWDWSQYGVAFAQDVAVTTAGVISVTVHEYYVEIWGHTGCGPPNEDVSLCRWSLDGTALSRTDYGPGGSMETNYAGHAAAMESGNVVACMSAAMDNYSARVYCMNSVGGTVWYQILSGVEIYTLQVMPTYHQGWVLTVGSIGEVVRWWDKDPSATLLDPTGQSRAFLRIGELAVDELVGAATELPKNSFAFAWTKPSAVSGRIFVTKARITTVVH